MTYKMEIINVVLGPEQFIPHDAYLTKIEIIGCLVEGKSANEFFRHMMNPMEAVREYAINHFDENLIVDIASVTKACSVGYWRNNMIHMKDGPYIKDKEYKIELTNKGDSKCSHFYRARDNQSPGSVKYMCILCNKEITIDTQYNK